MAARVFIGPAGFSYKDWEGIVYPKDLKKRKLHPLEYLARFFDCCEINTSFYGHLRPEIARRWCEMVEAVQPDFLFTAKLYKAFTHAPAAQVQSTSAAVLAPTAEDEKLARVGLDALTESERLGAVLAQFPISFRNTDENRAYLSKLIERFTAYPLVVEVRHATWDDAAVLADFAERGVAFCNIDQPRLGKALRATSHTTSQIAYTRLHGRNYKDWFRETAGRDERYNYLYTRKDLEPWVERVEQTSKKAERSFVVTNNHYKGKAAANALEIKSMLSGKKVKAPSTLVETYPKELGDCTLPEE